MVRQVVRQVQELYMDFLPLGPDLFPLDIPSCMSLEPPSWDQPLFDALCSGITAAMLALKVCLKYVSFRACHQGSVCVCFRAHMV